jgi:hypothetical protein
MILVERQTRIESSGSSRSTRPGEHQRDNVDE